MSAEIATLRPQDIETGRVVSFEHLLTDADLDAFAALTGDISPLHMDRDFARSRGFRDRVAHGVLLGGLISRLFGVHLPGRDCILHSMNLKWSEPACVGDLIRLTATVSQISVEAMAMMAEVSVINVETGAWLAKGKVQAGFTGSEP
jgi:3-hydroxybutyryl-CoA dehydratase